MEPSSLKSEVEIKASELFKLVTEKEVESYGVNGVLILKKPVASQINNPKDLKEVASVKQNTYIVIHPALGLFAIDFIKETSKDGLTWTSNPIADQESDMLRRIESNLKGGDQHMIKGLSKRESSYNYGYDWRLVVQGGGNNARSANSEEVIQALKLNKKEVAAPELATDQANAVTVISNAIDFLKNAQ